MGVIMAKLRLVDLNDLEAALKEARKRLDDDIVIIIDIHEGVTDSRILQSVSGFVKEYGYEQKLATMVVVCSTAGSAFFIPGDNRKINFFVPPWTLSELKGAKDTIARWIHKKAEDIDDKTI